MNLNNLSFLFLEDNGLNVTDLDPQLEAFLNGLGMAYWEPQDPSICSASLATLAFFKAVPDSKGVLLEWQTLSESENAGFYILRGEPISSECTSNQSDYYEVVKVGFKPTEGDGFSVAPYSYWDDTVKPKTTYCYLLEDVDFGGVVTSHWDLITSVTTR
jgi:arabinogalactan endo-1,4-beta-galactosidase